MRLYSISNTLIRIISLKHFTNFPLALEVQVLFRTGPIKMHGPWSNWFKCLAEMSTQTETIEPTMNETSNSKRKKKFLWQIFLINFFLHSIPSHWTCRHPFDFREKWRRANLVRLVPSGRKRRATQYLIWKIIFYFVLKLDNVQSSVTSGWPQNFIF